MTDAAPSGSGSEPRLARLPAPLKAAAILVYFGVAAAWLPSKVLQTTTMSEASSWVADTVGVVIWLVAVAVGFVGLRVAQRRGIV